MAFNFILKLAERNQCAQSLFIFLLTLCSNSY
ncbi:hypothetical protein T05_15015 [Trichinella murrelli]|uniref:Uncharacterized protein n=1 Tax=Trichinella murrelli TaxID=144512 RepID=A0A0V0SU42_9BILA|nr:hypothetical protein T05_15015 [Trichinella murrelli]